MFFNLCRIRHRLLYGCYHLYCCVVCSVTRRVVVVVVCCRKKYSTRAAAKKSPLSVELVMTLSVHNRPYADRKMTVFGHKCQNLSDRAADALRQP
jgi:hypothetical protein